MTIRLAWLITRFVREEGVTLDAYQARFAMSLRSFHRDIAVLREAGLYLDTDGRGWYKLLYFRNEP